MSGLKPFVYRSGAIVFRKRMPPGSLPVTRMKHSKLCSIVKALARRGYPKSDGSKGLLLVPGIPEAKDSDAALDALCRFKSEVERRLRPHTSKRRRV